MRGKAKVKGKGKGKVREKGKGENGEASLATSAATDTSTPLGSIPASRDAEPRPWARTALWREEAEHFLSCGLVCSVG
jgi:hypothetical protein